MVLTRSLGELMDEQMVQYYQIVLNINDRAFKKAWRQLHKNSYSAQGPVCYGWM